MHSFTSSGRSSRETGVLGERIAAERLERAGMRILFRNWRAKEDQRLEIDLVAQDGATLVFVEVKTLDATAMQSGRSRIDARKRAALGRAKAAYLKLLRRRPPHRFDAVEVYLSADGRADSVIHLQNLSLSRRRRPSA
jgi:putative endonuclease